MKLIAPTLRLFCEIGFDFNFMCGGMDVFVGICS